MCIARIFAIGIEHGDAADALRWHRQLVRWKWAYRKRGRGRPPLDVETVELITRLGRENPRWGCVRMQGELRKLGISRRCELDQTDPPPGRPRAGAPPDWSDVERIPQSAGQGVLACDFLTAETVFLKTVYVLFFIELATRRVHVAGATARPDSAWVTQHAGNLSVAGRLEDKHMLVRDRDAKFSGSFNEVFRTEGLRVLKTPVRAPRANAFAERWIGTLRRECVDHPDLRQTPSAACPALVRRPLQPGETAQGTRASPT